MKHRILVVDDDEVLRRPLQRTLEVHGYDVVAVATGEEALAALSEIPVDLLVTDRGLPGMDGWELIRLVAATRPEVRIVLITASIESTHETVPGQTRVEGTLRKPFEPEDLLALVAQALESRPSGSSRRTRRSVSRTSSASRCSSPPRR